MADTADHRDDRRRGPRPRRAGGLQVEDRVAVTSEPPRGLADEFRHAGFPGETATIPWQAFEDRAVTWTGSVDNINSGPRRRRRARLRPAVRVARVPARQRRRRRHRGGRVHADRPDARRPPRTSSARSTPSPPSPRSRSTLTIVTTPLKQVAAIYTNVPNVYLEQPAFNTVIENDLRLAHQRRPRQADPRLHRHQRVPGARHRQRCS